MPQSSNAPLNSGSLAYFTVELDNMHPVPQSWSSTDPSTGYARVLIDLDTKVIHRMEMVVDGMFVTGDPGSDNLHEPNITTLQPFHFHNVPQGGPQFFVQQLFDVDGSTGEITTATLENTDTGLRFEIADPYALRDPVNNAELGDVVLPEILAGNGYLGLHTVALPIPATSIAGEIHAFGAGTLDGEIAWHGDGMDVDVGGDRNDLLSLGGGNDVGLGRDGNDVIDGGAGNDRIFGQRGDDVAWGGDGDDLVTGGRGNDMLFGNRGDDILNGGAGNDSLEGGIGADTLTGGRGDDTMTGGADADTFVLSLFSGNDTITDFTVGEDEIEFLWLQRVLDAELADLDGGGTANDTLLTLIGGQVEVLNADLTGEF